MILTDEQLAQKLRIKDEATIRYLVQNYSSLLYKACNTILKNQTLVEEAVQDSFLKIIHGVHSFDHKASLKTWMYTIAYRTAIDYHRRLKYSEDLDQVTQSASESRADLELERSEDQLKIFQMLETLNLDDRKIVTLFYLEELSIKEVCDIMEMSEANVKVRLFRARKALQSIVGQYFENPGM